MLSQRHTALFILYIHIFHKKKEKEVFELDTESKVPAYTKINKKN